jgi:hypothetical protein
VVEKVSFEFRDRTCEKIPLDVETLWSTLHPQRDKFAQQVKTLPTKLFGLNAKPKQKIFGGVSDSILSQSFSFFLGARYNLCFNFWRNLFIDWVAYKVGNSQV